MVFQNDILAGSSGGSSASSVYKIDQSIRFNDDDTAYLKKDYGSDGSQTTFTLSGWLKLGILTGTAHSLFATGFLNGSAADFTLYFTGDQLYFFGGYNGGTSTNRLETTQLFRDHSSWYHIVFVADTTNAVSSERLRLYVNGSRVTAFDTETYPSQNDTLVWGDATYSHVIGASGDDMAGSLNSQTPRYHYDGYMAEIVYIDGTALDPSSFGEYNSSNIWIPKDVSSLSFGANGFYLKGESASDLGNDSSSNNNDFTTSGLASHDQVPDSPTNVFSTYNPLANPRSGALSQGSLRFVHASGQKQGCFSTIGMNSGKWYIECYCESLNNGYLQLGIQDFAYHNNENRGIGGTQLSPAYDYAYFGFNGNKLVNGTSSSYGNTFATDDVIGVAIDLDNNYIYFAKNNTWQNSGDPTSGASGTGGISVTTPSSTASGFYLFGTGVGTGSSGYNPTTIINFGQDSTFVGENVNANDYSNYVGASDGNSVGSFFYTPPSGYLALCTKNLGS